MGRFFIGRPKRRGKGKTDDGQGRPQAGWRPTQGGLAPVKGNAAQRRFCRVAGKVSRKTALPQTETKGMARRKE